MPERQLAELKKLREMVEEIKIDIDSASKKPLWKKMLNAFLIGIVRGLGILIGTTVIVGILVFLAQTFVDWTDIQLGITSWMSGALEQGVKEAIPAGISSFIN